MLTCARLQTLMTSALGTYLASSAAMPCPDGTANVASGLSIASCVDIQSGFSLPDGTHTAVTNFTRCGTPGTYCPGELGVLTLSSPTVMVRASATDESRLAR
jgi:hypothetical protein